MRVGTRIQFFLPLLMTLVVMAFVVGMTVWETIRRERANLQHRLDAIVSTLDNAHFPLTEAVLHQMKGLTGAEFCLYTPIASVSTVTPMPQQSLFESHPANSSSKKELDATVEISGHEYFLRMHHRPISEKPSSGVLAILYPVSRWHDTLMAAIRPVIIFGVGGIALAAGLTLFLGNRLVNRIHHVEAQTRRIAMGDFSPMPVPARNDELRDLAISVNDMAQQLHMQQESLRDGERWRILGQMAGGLAHQLRNGVTGIKLSLQLCRREMTHGPLEPLEVAERQLALIESQLRRFLETGRRPAADATSIKLSDIAREVLALLQPRCRHHGIALKTSIDDGLPELLGDRQQWQQLFVNLIENALDAAGPGGDVELNMSFDRNTIQIDVLDSGTGPPSNIAESLFDPFVTGKPDGIGLGLSVVRKVVEDMNGKVTWDRVAGRTRFQVSVPIHKAGTPQTVRREVSYA